MDIINQVCEGLLVNDLIDSELSPIPRLVEDLGIWNAEATEIAFTLRQNVTFHDETPFNAIVVKNSFDHLTHLIEGKISHLIGSRLN